MQCSVGAARAPFLAGPTSLRQAVPRQQQQRATRQPTTCTMAPAEPTKLQRPGPDGRFGKYGGKYVPETLIVALAELEEAYAAASQDPAFLVRNGAAMGRELASG